MKTEFSNNAFVSFGIKKGMVLTMKFNKHGLVRNSSLLMLLLYLVTFLFYYIPNFVYVTDITLYISTFVMKAAYLLLPLIASLIAFVISGFDSKRAAVLTLIPLSLARLIYMAPTFYLFWIVRGFDSIDALLFGALLALGDAVIVYGISVGVMFIMRVISSYKSGRSTQGEKLCEREMLNLSNGATLAIFSVSLICFVYFFAKEIIDTVTYLVSSEGIYRSGEIIYILICFVYDILLLPLFHMALFGIKNFIVKKRVEE